MSTSHVMSTRCRDALKLEALSERGMGKAVGEFVKKDDNEAIFAMVSHQVKDLNATLGTVSISVGTS